jgi:hypothetical protein
VPRLNLQKRERYIVAVGVALALVLVFRFVAEKPLRSYRNSRVAAAAATTRLEQARSIRDQIVADRSAGDAMKKLLASRGQGDLAAFINRQLAQAGLLEDRASWRNSQRFADTANFDQVDVTLTGVTLDEIVNFLHGIYNGQNVVVAHTMHIEPVVGGTGLTCRIILLSPKA